MRGASAAGRAQDVVPNAARRWGRVARVTWVARVVVRRATGAAFAWTRTIGPARRGASIEHSGIRRISAVRGLNRVVTSIPARREDDRGEKPSADQPRPRRAARAARAAEAARRCAPRKRRRT
ncbi:hypothetical protein AKJ09_08836 [Labilithrix luteola]|uniref:Uncharacterized protein n=1 Tax=Labilithrix luteola TaxID=1391654 RepID=A0A0K1Q8V8_9BACT|nr:hypothetical protein AKJ09_08836 [Labilithrix luteola]